MENGNERCPNLYVVAHDVRKMADINNAGIYQIKNEVDKNFPSQYHVIFYLVQTVMIG